MVCVDGQYYPQYNERSIEDQFHVINLKVYHAKGSTGFETSQHMQLNRGEIVAGRYVICDYLGQAAFSRAVSARDLKNNNRLVCLKVIKNSKEFFDQSLDEIKLLQYINKLDPHDEHNLLRLYDYFYFREHLILVCELLMENLYEWQKLDKDNHIDPYFTLPRIQHVARQVLSALAFIHKHGIIHSDLKPENILIKDPDTATIKVIDLGSSCFLGDVDRNMYLQSRSYRAPEVILGLKYGTKIDIWSLGAILVELFTSIVLFQNEPVATILARIEGIIGPIPNWMIAQGRTTSEYYTRRLDIYQSYPEACQYDILKPHKLPAGLASKLPGADPLFAEFCTKLLCIDPSMRPTAQEALEHPWLQKEYGRVQDWEPAYCVFRHLQFRGPMVTEEELEMMLQFKQRSVLSVERTEKLLKKNGLPSVFTKMAQATALASNAHSGSVGHSGVHGNSSSLRGDVYLEDGAP